MTRALSALLALLAACSAPSGSSDIAPPSGEGLGVEVTSLIRGLSESEGRRVVSLDLRNEVGRTIEFTWAVEWMDGAGETCPGTPSGWQTARLEAGATVPVEIKAPTSDATSWRIIAIERAH